jgi:hypothetical protein
MIAVPAFILKKFYVPNSLQETPLGVQFALQNPICPGSFTSIVDIGLSVKQENPKTPPSILWCPPERILFLFENGTEVQGNLVTPENPVPILLHSKATCLLKEVTLQQVRELTPTAPEESPVSYGLHIDASLHGIGRLTVHIPV